MGEADGGRGGGVGGEEGNFYGNEIGELSGVYKWGAGWTRQGRGQQAVLCR